VLVNHAGAQAETSPNTERGKERLTAGVFVGEGAQVRTTSTTPSPSKVVRPEEHAVSRENLKIVLRAYAHRQAAGDFRDDLYAPNFVWDMSNFQGWPEQRIYEGIEEARRFIREWASAFEDWKIEVERLYDAGGDKVVGIVRQRGRSKASGLPVDMLFAQVFTVQDGKETRMEMYSDPAEALKAVGLDE
jgi:ketosteroid isomerase-like protein